MPLPPNQAQPLIDAVGRMTREWYLWATRFGTSLSAPAGGAGIAVFTGPSTLAGGNLSGPVTTTGTTITAITPTGVTPGTYGDATHVPIVTVLASGQIASASQVVFAVPPADWTSSFLLMGG